MASYDNPQNPLPFSWEEARKKPEAVYTRDGRGPVKLAGYNPDANPGYEIIGWLKGDYYSWRPDGKFNATMDSDIDLVIRRENNDRFMNVYAGSATAPHLSLKGAIERAMRNRQADIGTDAIAVLRLSFTEDGGLEGVSIAHRYSKEEVSDGE